MGEAESAFQLLAKPIRRLVEERGFSKPTAPQQEAIPRILAGKNLLLISPTATGKTEAAILPILSMLIQLPERKPGIKILYITPLRALNRDLLDRLEWWCTHLDVRLSVRHGDTDRNERARQARSPPDLLITTPETLQAILPARIMGRHLRSVRWVIVDEVHEMVDSKRGSQLSLAMERLRRLADAEPQVVGLSATIGEPERVARFLVGEGRDVEVVKVPVARQMRLRVVYPKPTRDDQKLAAKLYTHPEVAARLRVMKDLVSKSRSTLLFTNTRSISEILASRFKIWDLDFPLSIHHGSLSKPSRVSAERGLKNGDLRALVCTSSLELGIDVGRVDLVIQYMSPRQATRLVQRVGRSGHRVGRVAEGVIVTMDSDDTLEAMVVARRALNEELERLKIPECPYDALAHQIAGLLLEKRRWKLQEILELFRRAHPYRNLTLDDLRKVVSYMHNRPNRLAWFSEEDMVVLKPRRSKALYRYYFEHLSMIPDEKQYLVVDEEDDTPVGILDEAFMAEYGRPGVKFIIRGSPWVIVDVAGEKVYVRRDDDPTGAIPSWVGEEIPVPFEVAREVGRVRGMVEELVRAGVPKEEISRRLARDYPVDGDAALRAIEETVAHARMGYPVPTDRRIVVEGGGGYIIIHAHLGTLTNRSLSHLVGSMLSEREGLAIPIQHDPYRIVVQVGGAYTPGEVADVLRELASLPGDAIRERLEATTVRTGIFKRRMLHVAKRFGAIQKWADLSSVSLSKLLRSFEGTAIYDEALKEVFTKDLDLEHTLQVLDEVRRGEVEVVTLETGESLSPIGVAAMERMSMKTDLIPPERLRRILVEAAKARLLSEARVFVCTNCWSYLELMRVKDLPDAPRCPNCGSTSLGVLNVDEEEAYPLVEKAGEKLNKREEALKREARRTARLISKYGKAAAIALAGKSISVKQAEEVLMKEAEPTDRLFELVLEAERKALKARFARWS